MRLILFLALFFASPAAAQWTAAAARDTLAEVRASAAEGLNPADYGGRELEAALAGGDAARIAAAAQASWLALARDYAAGRTPEAARVGWKSPPPRSDPEWLRARLADGLAAGAPGPALRALLPTHPYYVGLKAALGRTADADARARLRANLDRWRWMPRQLGSRYLLVNVPQFEAELWEGGQVVERRRIIAGKPSTPTPQFSDVVTGVVFNPEWVVPQSIIRKSVGALVRNSPSVARARGYRWKQADGHLSVVQVPGGGNSLGRVKLEMTNPYAIYMHDTPAKALFSRASRALSHGCMRTEDIASLALALLDGVPGWDAARIARTIAGTTTTRVPLARQVPVHVGYFTVVPAADGTPITYADIYHRDPPVIEALSR